MLKFKKFWLAIALLLLTPVKAIAEEDYPRSLVNAIASVEDAKELLRGTFKDMAQCNAGSCINATTTHICEIVGALDVKAKGKILGNSFFGREEAAIPISNADLSLMKQIFSQCEPTNYQYWLWGSMLHVSYQPDSEADRQIRQALDIE